MAGRNEVHESFLPSNTAKHNAEHQTGTEAFLAVNLRSEASQSTGSHLDGASCTAAASRSLLVLLSYQTTTGPFLKVIFNLCCRYLERIANITSCSASKNCQESTDIKLQIISAELST